MKNVLVSGLFALLPVTTTLAATKKTPRPISPPPVPVVAIPVPPDWNVRSTADIARIKSVDPVLSNELRLDFGYGANTALKLDSYHPDTPGFKSSQAPAMNFAWRSTRLMNLGRGSLHVRLGLGLEPLRRRAVVEYATFAQQESQWSMNFPSIAALEAELPLGAKIQGYVAVGGGTLTAVTTRSALGPERTYTGGRLLADLGADWSAAWMPRATALTFGAGVTFDRVAGQSINSFKVRSGVSIYL